jgi:hypothetical protein
LNQSASTRRASLPAWGWCDAQLGCRWLVGHNSDGAVVAQRGRGAVNDSQLAPLLRLSELEIALLREKPPGIGHGVGRVPGLVSRDVWKDAVGDEPVKIFFPEAAYL